MALTVAAVVAGFYLSRRIPVKERFTGRRRLWYAGYLIARWKRYVLRKLSLDGSEESYFRELYVNEHPGAKRMEADCRFGVVALLLCLGLSVAVLWSAHAGGFAATRLRTIERPASGTGVATMNARFRGEQFSLSVPVTEKQMSAEELRASAAEAEEKMLSWVLAANPSADFVTQPLYFPDRVPGTPIAIAWSTSDYRVVDYSGGVHPEYCSEEGELVVLTALMTYGDWEATMQIPVRVCLPEGTTDADRKMLEETLAQAFSEQAYDDSVNLPEQIGGEGVEFYRERRFSPWMFGVYTVLFGIVLFLTGFSRRKQRRKERERQMLRDYPELVSKMTLLMEAGSTIRLAWERITEDYVRHRTARSEPAYVYEEMLHTKNRLSLGVSEEVAYEEFGRRCGNIRYLRFASVLVQNLTKGSAGVLPLLREEAAEAFCDRREQAKQRGEEAGTKLLLPMAGILIIILAMILVPAFLSL